MKERATVTVPASSGNIGPGFDVLGLALTLRNELHARVLRSSKGPSLVRVIGEGEGTLPTGPRNLIFQTMAWLFKKAKHPMPSLEVTCVNRIPLARGLGSSSAAYLSALLAANRLMSDKFSKNQILEFASKLEGHPDNVAPALLGGVKASGIFNGRVVTASLPVPKLRMVTAIPAFHLSTKKARAVLPKKVWLRDAIHNLSSVALMSHAFKEDYGLLKSLLNDRLHEPYRARLVPGFYQVKRAAIKAGALGVILSGAGPTLLAMAPESKAAKVGKAMTAAFSRAGVESSAKIFEIDIKGATVQ